MCDIAGFELGPQGGEETGSRLLAALAHRGPDRGWFTARGAYGLVQTRLAVVDLSERVVYPMANESRDMWLLFNGEVYDHPRLRAELERKGHSFRTQCDAEVILHGYEEWGLDVFSRIDGIFALALWNERASELLLTRDPLGVKPLVYTTTGWFAEQLGVRHVCRDRELEFHDALDSVRGTYDQPFADASAIAILAVARMAREEVTVGLSEVDHESVLGAIQAFEMRTYLPSDLLTKEDRATMAVGLEGRVPLLGRDLLALAEGFDDRQMITFRAGKRVLRKIAARRLPARPAGSG